MYESKLYKFKTAHTAGGWNSAQVDAVSVNDEISGLKGDLNEIIEQGILSHFVVDSEGYVCQKVEVV